MVQFTDYIVRGRFAEDGLKISELTNCIPRVCFGRMNEKFPAGGVYELSYDDALREAKEAVVSPEPLSMRQAKFLKVIQKDGELFVSFLSRARAALIDTNYRLQCPHAIPPAKGCGTAGCPTDGISYGEGQL